MMIDTKRLLDMISYYENNQFKGIIITEMESRKSTYPASSHLKRWWVGLHPFLQEVYLRENPRWNGSDSLKAGG